MPVQVGVDPADDVVQVVQPALQVGVVHGREHRGQAIALGAQGVAGRVAFLADQGIERIDQLRIVQQQSVQVDELDRFARQGALQLFAQDAHLGAGGVDGFMQARDLGLDPGGRDVLFAHLQRMRQAHPGPAQGQAACGAVPGAGQPHRPLRPGRP